MYQALFKQNHTALISPCFFGPPPIFGVQARPVDKNTDLTTHQQGYQLISTDGISAIDPERDYLIYIYKNLWYILQWYKNDHKCTLIIIDSMNPARGIHASIVATCLRLVSFIMTVHLWYMWPAVWEFWRIVSKGWLVGQNINGSEDVSPYS